MNKEELVERTIFHAIRNKVVMDGYLPDIFNYDIRNLDNNIASLEQQRYFNDVKNIKDTKGFAIEVFGYSQPQQRGEKKSPRFVINTHGFQPGDIGLDTTAKYVRNNDGTFTKQISDTQLADMYIDIYLIANTTKQIRTLHDILSRVLPKRGYIKWYTENKILPSGNLYVNFESLQDYTWTAEGIIEKAYRYEAKDINDIEDFVLANNIPPILDIDIAINNTNLNLEVQPESSGKCKLFIIHN